MGSLFTAAAVVQPAAAVMIPQTTRQMPSLITFKGKLFLAWYGRRARSEFRVFD